MVHRYKRGTHNSKDKFSSLTLPSHLYESARRIGKVMGFSTNHVMNLAIEEYVDKYKLYLDKYDELPESAKK